MYSRLIKKNIFLNVLNKCFGFFRPLNFEKKFNQNFAKFWGYFPPLEHCDVLIVFSRATYSHLVNRIRNKKHILIIDSWDHPVKAPFFLNPNLVLVWNSYVKMLTRDYQNFNRIKLTKNYKFQYINDCKEKPIELLDLRLKSDLAKLSNNEKIALYPITLGIGTGKAFHEELNLIKLLAKEAIKHNHKIH